MFTLSQLGTIRHLLRERETDINNRITDNIFPFLMDFYKNSLDEIYQILDIIEREIKTLKKEK